jgi:hypothetical protein
MRRPINWVVFCLSLLFLYANLSFGRRPAPPVVQSAATLTTVQPDFSHVVIAERTAPQFGYLRDDGSFLPLPDESLQSPRLAGDTGVLTSASPSWQ